MKTLVTVPSLKIVALCARRRVLLVTACLSILFVLLLAGSSPAGALASASCDVPNFKDTIRFAAGKFPAGLAVADFNGDNLLDVAVANKGANDGDNTGSVSILLGDAVSLFKQGVSINAGLNPRAVVAGDFNRDNKVDLAVLSFGPSCCIQGAVTILLGDSAGNFTPTGNFSSTGSNPSSMKVADFNADGNSDVAVLAAGSPSAGVYVLLGNGSGGLGASTFYATGGGPGGQVALGDFNGDSKLDIAASNNNGAGVSVVLGDGAGGFGPKQTTSLSFNASTIAPGDFNGDGKLDLVSATVNSVILLIGDGAGKFTAGSPVFTLEISYAVAAGDFNGDGKLDVAVTNISSAVSILLGDGAGGFGTPSNFGTGIGPTFFVVGDFDRDGKADLLTADGLSDDLAFLKGEGTGDFKAPGVFNVGLTPVDAARGDFNGDGRPDLAVANGNQSFVSILLGSGNNKFTAAPIVNVSSGPSFIAVADFNGDAKQDLAIATASPVFTTVWVVLGDGAGGFGSPTAFDVDTQLRTVVVADFDNDGNADMAVVSAGGAAVYVLLGNGAGGFASPIKMGVGGFPFSLVTADFNRDCNADLVVIGDSNGASILLGDGTGKFAAPASLSPPPGTRSAAAGDLDGDGNTDLVFANPDPFNGGPLGSAVVLLGNGAGGFGAPVSYGVGQSRELTALADFNGDGKLDIALLNSSNSISVLLNAGNGTFPTATDFPVTAGRSFLVAGDLSGDGSPDLAVNSGASSSVSVLFNSCPGAASAGRPTAVQFSAPCFGVMESRAVVSVGVKRTGDLTGETTVDYSTSKGTASDVSDYTTALGRLHFAPNESDKSLRIIITDDAFVETPERFQVSLTNPSGAALGSPANATVIIKDTDTSPGPNPITPESGNTAFFVRQHYADFLNREPDAPGLAFWTNEIESCGTNTQCREVKRINVSAAFFLSIEFQETGYLVERTYKAAYGDATSPGVSGTVPVIHLSEFLPDTQFIGQGLIVGQGNWQAQLEANKVAYFADFVSRPRFVSSAPTTLSPAQFVDTLFSNAGVTPTTAQRQAAIDEFAGAGNTADFAARGRALRRVAENPTLQQRELNRAFVLMEYYGYLRRNPNDAPEPTLNFAGWKFWLDKLNLFGGNFVQAEMVKAFISSDEYRHRFGQ
jgi:hypothetical protein